MRTVEGRRLPLAEEDVTTVREALARLGDARLCEQLWAMGPGRAPEEGSARQRYRFASQACDWIEAWRGSPGGKGAQGVIVPFEWYEAQGAPYAALGHRLGAAFAPDGLLQEAGGLLEASGGFAYELDEVRAACRLLPAARDEAPWSWRSLRSSMGALSRQGTACVLETPLWVPSALCEDEAARFVASVAWALMPHGRPLSQEPPGAQAGAAVPSFADAPPAARAPGARAAERLVGVACLMNYNCWVSTLEDCAALGRLRKGKHD